MSRGVEVYMDLFSIEHGTEMHLDLTNGKLMRLNYCSLSFLLVCFEKREFDCKWKDDVTCIRISCFPWYGCPSGFV